MGRYPTAKELRTIRNWKLMLLDDHMKLARFVASIWETWGTPGPLKGRTLRLATGGWSGNEDIIEALRTTLFHIICWQSSHRGGLHIYKVPTK